MRYLVASWAIFAIGTLAAVTLVDRLGVSPGTLILAVVVGWAVALVGTSFAIGWWSRR